MGDLVTHRLYYTDPYLTDFDATVVSTSSVDGRTMIVLDRTAFYPTSGGQPFDVGALGDARVVDVLDLDDGNILHVIEGDPPAGRVQGRVRWDRRFDHMQQHTGQHLLSAAFDRLCGVGTVSFHLGSTAATIDLEREVTAAEIVRAEDAANQVVWEDRPVAIRFVDEEEATQLPLRKESARSGSLRIIEIEGFDVSACGGTHVRRTGAVGLIAVASWERFKGGTRLEFVCGGRALRASRMLRDTVAAADRLMSTGPEELLQGIERVQAENRELKRHVRELESELAARRADALAAGATVIAGARVAIESLPDVDMNGLKAIAQEIVARPGYAAVLLTASPPVGIVIARAGDVALDASALLQKLTAEFGGKGGGRPALAQGGGLTAAPQKIIDAAKAALAG
jgi:alanyl-tRNA synthetase